MRGIVGAALIMGLLAILPDKLVIQRLLPMGMIRLLTGFVVSLGLAVILYGFAKAHGDRWELDVGLWRYIVGGLIVLACRAYANRDWLLADVRRRTGAQPRNIPRSTLPGTVIRTVRPSMSATSQEARTMTANLIPRFRRVLNDQQCSIERRESDWTFQFGESCQLCVQAPWRLVGANEIVLSSEDDGHLFGRTSPVDVSAETGKLLISTRVSGVDIDRPTADLNVQFDNGLRLHIYNQSCGYEGWQAYFSCGGETIGLIGLGGGRIGYYRHAIDLKPQLIETLILPDEAWDVA